jgi:hypothetical protein
MRGLYSPPTSLIATTRFRARTGTLEIFDKRDDPYNSTQFALTICVTGRFVERNLDKEEKFLDKRVGCWLVDSYTRAK